MLSFKKKFSILNSNFLNGFVDIHSHILSGVDDGIKNVEDSFNTLQYLEQLGVDTICFTPHIMTDYEANNHEFLSLQFEDFKTKYDGNIKLRLAAEYMLDSNFNKHLYSENTKMLAISNTHLLVETSYLNPPLNFYNTVEEIKRKGYFLILAHPERYLYMNKDDFNKLRKDAFIFLQLNILSLVGYYGKKPQENSQYLLKNGFYTFIGSDIHNLEAHLKGYNIKQLTSKQVSMIENLKENNRKLLY